MYNHCSNDSKVLKIEYHLSILKFYRSIPVVNNNKEKKTRKFKVKIEIQSTNVGRYACSLTTGNMLAFVVTSLSLGSLSFMGKR